MSITNNRIVWVQPTRIVGTDAEGNPIHEPAPGYHVNVDARILTDAGTAGEAGPLLAAVQPYVVTQGSVSQATQQLSGTVDTLRKVAVRVAANNFQVAGNGALGTLDSAGNLPTGLTTVRLGSGPSANWLHGGICKAWIESSALTDAKLQQITT